MSISVEVPVVTLDVVAATQNGDIIPGLKKENFRILEDGQPQTITSFGPTDAPITMVVLMEFSARFYGWFGYQAKYWAGALFPNLNQKDWVALNSLHMLNPERLLWANDFPHPDACWPNSQALLSDHAAHLSPTERSAIVHDNVRRLYGLAA